MVNYPMKKTLAIFASILVVAPLLTACGSSSSEDAEPAKGEAPPKGQVLDQSNMTPEQREMIKRRGEDPDQAPPGGH